MIRVSMILLICVLCLAAGPGMPALADSLSDDEAAIAAHIKALHDEQSEVREAAAKALRLIVAKYPSGTSNIRSNDGGEAYWTEKVNQVTPGMTKSEAAEILPPQAGSPYDWGVGTGQSHSAGHRLDHQWVVTIQFYNPDEVIDRPKLIKRELLVYVAPPKDYTGTWTCWYVNGQKGDEREYKEGKHDGVLTHFHDNGRKMSEQHSVGHVGHGPSRGWHPDGKLSYTGRYDHGKQDGKWTHWHPNGRKSSESNYTNGVSDGLHASWYESGQMRFEINYKSGVKHGREAAWNEQGVAHYDRECKNGEVVE